MKLLQSSFEGQERHGNSLPALLTIWIIFPSTLGFLIISLILLSNSVDNSAILHKLRSLCWLIKATCHSIFWAYRQNSIIIACLSFCYVCSELSVSQKRLWTSQRLRSLREASQRKRRIALLCTINSVSFEQELELCSWTKL